MPRAECEQKGPRKLGGPYFNQPHNKPLQTDERRVLVVSELQITLAPLAA